MTSRITGVSPYSLGKSSVPRGQLDSSAAVDRLGVKGSGTSAVLQSSVPPSAATRPLGSRLGRRAAPAQPGRPPGTSLI